MLNNENIKDVPSQVNLSKRSTDNNTAWASTWIDRSYQRIYPKYAAGQGVLLASCDSSYEELPHFKLVSQLVRPWRLISSAPFVDPALHSHLPSRSR
jgi:hypothetical protein